MVMMMYNVQKNEYKPGVTQIKEKESKERYLHVLVHKGTVCIFLALESREAKNRKKRLNSLKSQIKSGQPESSVSDSFVSCYN